MWSGGRVGFFLVSCTAHEQKMGGVVDRIFLGGVVVSGIVVLSMVVDVDPEVGAIVCMGSAGLFLLVSTHYVLNRSRRNTQLQTDALPESCDVRPWVPEVLDGGCKDVLSDPNQGWDPELVEAAHRRSEGID